MFRMRPAPLLQDPTRPLLVTEFVVTIIREIRNKKTVSIRSKRSNRWCLILGLYYEGVCVVYRHTVSPGRDVK
jgi:hypothetical protein